MSVSCGIFVQFCKCKILMSGKFASFIASCTAVGAERGIKGWFRNNRNYDDGFEYLRINSLSGNVLTKMILFCFK
jgi:hypothetical protein